MRTIIILTALLGFSLNLFSQSSIDSVLAMVERNNTTLAAYRKSFEAEIIGNRTGLLLQNPEMAFNYLWGNPSAIGNRTDFSIRQSFDFPTAYAYKSQIATGKNQQAVLEYQKRCKEIRHKARLICVGLVYQNALCTEYSVRLANAKHIADAYHTKFEQGDVGILAYNKAQMLCLNSLKVLEGAEIERNAQLAELVTLNGGVPISFSENIFSLQAISCEFEQWYAQAEQYNPVLQWIKQEIAIGEKQKLLAKAQSLPKFNAGYMSEKVVGQQFQGVTIGVSIPLWENKNTVKYANAKIMAMQSMQTDAVVQFYNERKALHAKVIRLQGAIADYRSKLNAFGNTALLQKALDKGEISLGEYFFELSFYYESFDKLLQMEYDLAKTIAELNKDL